MPPRSEIADFIESIPGNALLGLKVTQMGEGVGEVVLPWRDKVANHVGTVHAAALFGIADAASGAALFAGLGDLALTVTPIARGGEIRYSRPARGDITGRARVPDQQVATIREELAAEGVSRPDVVVTMTDADGAEVAEATFHWRITVS